MASKHYKRFVELYGPSNKDFAKAMNEVGKAKIARELGCSLQTVYYLALTRATTRWVALKEVEVDNA